MNKFIKVIACDRQEIINVDLLERIDVVSEDTVCLYFVSGMSMYVTETMESIMEKTYA